MCYRYWKFQENVMDDRFVENRLISLSYSVQIHLSILTSPAQLCRCKQKTYMWAFREGVIVYFFIVYTSIKNNITI
jgi:hypothetical protein